MKEEIRTLETYPFSEPNPIPILTRDPRLYPYHTFEGYVAESTPREWKVVRLENDLIQVFVLPEVGGKVWGAVVKETGHEFIYRNEVMKFRNIALRGPWTSGGIELNFGVIGHTPATATPVDYLTRENPDGSVSCVVGSMDLPSRTHWRVEIRLPADKAYFETRVFWYNPTPLEQPYYNWMTAAAFARDDLEMAMPGDRYLHHSGEAESWPLNEEGRYLPLYRNNTFGGHKSYHVVGELHDFFGGYYHDEDFGFGHWSRHEEMPGQKLWLWALSREGEVWEDLLTDSDGQYVEFQAGRLFVQYSPGAHLNPITEASFPPFSASRWSESWFPVEGLGGLTEASKEGAMYVEKGESTLTVRVHSFSHLSDTLEVWSGDRILKREPVHLKTLESQEFLVPIDPETDVRVRFPAMAMEYASEPSERRLSRPFETDPQAWATLPEARKLVFQGRELMKARRYREASSFFEEGLDREPWNRGALLGLAELAYRNRSLEEGLGLANRVLELDAYDAQANFLAGLHHRALGHRADAQDAFGWAARSTAYRSGAYEQLSELQLAKGEWIEATRYARLALDYDRYNVRAWQALAIIGRRSGDPALAEDALGSLTRLDPLHHFAGAEAYLADPSQGAAERFLASLGGEFPDQTLLELAVGYAGLGLPEDALALLHLDPPGGRGRGPVIRAWEAWLAEDPSLLEGTTDLAFAFPYRAETLPVLEWATARNRSWAWRYLLALNLWALGRDREARLQLEALGPQLSYAPGLVARAFLAKGTPEGDPKPDLQRAVALEPENRVFHLHLVRHLQEEGEWSPALQAAQEALRRFPGDFNLELLTAKSLIHLERSGEAIELLKETRVLPSENARESHRLWEEAHLLGALAALESGAFPEARELAQGAMEWPESLGQGRPYEPEERLARFLLGHAEQGMGLETAASETLQRVAAVDLPPVPRHHPLDLLTLAALDALGRAPPYPAPPKPQDPEWGALEEELSSTLQGRMILRALALRR